MFSLTIEDSNGQVAEQFSFDHGSYVIGRQDDCDIVLPSSSVSRRHAKLFVEGGRCYVEDLNSANGVTVDGQQVVAKRHLGTASQVRIGNFYLYLEYRGNEQLEDQDIRQTLFISDDPDHFRLVRVNDEFAGEEFTLSEVENTIGRTDDNFILLSDPSISRQHAVIRHQNDQYLLDDLGSSNGTRVNGDEVVQPESLEPGDIVEFGSVQFVFARGDEEIDPSSYGGIANRQSTFLLASVVTVVLLVGLVAGGLIVFGFWSVREGQNASAEPSQTLDAEIRSLVERGRSNLDRRKWDRAIENFTDVLALSPDHDLAKQLRQRARNEKKAERRLDRAESFSKEGKHEEALKVLRKIPPETDVYDRAEPTLEHVRKTIAFNLRNEAEARVDSESEEVLKSAHADLVRARKLAPDDVQTRRLLEEIESNMDRLDFDYEKSD